MSHISTGVEYALHCLIFLAALPPEAEGASARDLADMQGISPEFAAKLFTRLHKAGITVATEGVKGGFRLGRAPERISVHDVVLAIDGDKALFDCREIRHRCAVFGDSPPQWATEGVCSVHAVMLEAEKRMRDALRGHTLADLANRTAAKMPRETATEVVQWFGQRRDARKGPPIPASDTEA